MIILVIVLGILTVLMLFVLAWSIGTRCDMLKLKVILEKQKLRIDDLATWQNAFHPGVEHLTSLYSIASNQMKQQEESIIAINKILSKLPKGGKK